MYVSGINSLAGPCLISSVRMARTGSTASMTFPFMSFVELIADVPAYVSSR